MPVDKFDIGGPRLRDVYPVGVIHHVERPAYSDVFSDMRRRANGGGDG